MRQGKEGGEDRQAEQQVKGCHEVVSLAQARPIAVIAMSIALMPMKGTIRPPRP